ncbi:MAG: hypothetical protein LBD60_00625 [Puniceicoccales bacterium]|nr:hypothetical protein [Puniceicoccales bacterium]
MLKRLNRSTDSFSVKESPKWNLSFLPIKSRHAKENETKIIRRALREWKNDGLFSEELFQQLLRSLYPLGESSWNKKLKAFTESDFLTIIASI